MGLAAQIAQAARGTKARLFGRGDPSAAPRGAAPAGSGAVGYLSVASSRDSARLRSYESYLGAINIPDVFKCLSTISNTFCATDLRILDQDDEDIDLRERLPELDALMKRPNPEMRSRQFRQTLSHHYQLTGNAIVLKDNYDGLGRPTELWPLRPDKVHIVRSDVGKLAYGYDVTGQGKTRTEWYDGADILHVRWAHPSEPLWGLGVIEAGEQSFSRARLVNEFCVNFFSRGAIVDGILETAQEIPEEDRRALISDWRAFREGARNKLRTAVLWAGAKYTPIQEPLGNVPVMDLTKMSRNDIFQLFGVPPQLAGDFEGTNYRNAQEASQYYYGETLGPQLAQFAEDFWNPLLEDFDPDLRAEYEQREVVDYQVRAQATAQLAGTGSFSVNDLRVAAGYDPLPEDDELGALIPLPKGMTLLSPEQAAQLGEEAQEAPEELPPAPQVTELGAPAPSQGAPGQGQPAAQQGQQAPGGARAGGAGAQRSPAAGGPQTAQEQPAAPTGSGTKAGRKSYPAALLGPQARQEQRARKRRPPAPVPFGKPRLRVLPGRKDGWVTIEDHPVYIGGSGGTTRQRVEHAKEHGTYGNSPDRAGHGGGGAAGVAEPPSHEHERPGAFTSEEGARSWLAERGVQVRSESPAPVTLEHLNAVAREVDKLPQSITGPMVAARRTMQLISDHGISQFEANAHLRGVTPRGWPAGTGWDSIPGAARGGTTYIVANRLDVGHGSANLVLHEHGHTFDTMGIHDGGQFYSRSPQWQAVHSGVTWPTAYQQHYPEESFAESFAKYYNGGSGRTALPEAVQTYFSRFGTERH